MANSLIEFDIVARLQPAADLIKRYRTSLVLVLAANLLAYGYAMTNFTLAGDEWEVLLANKRHILDIFTLANGRWMQFLFYKYLLPNPFVPVMVIGISILLNIGTALWICNLWDIRSHIGVFFTAAIITLAPFWVEPFSFEIAGLSLSTAFLLTTLSFYLLSSADTENRSRYFYSLLALVAALAIYQISIIGFILVCGGYLLHRLLSGDEWSSRQIIAFSVKAAVAALAAVVVYFLSVKIQRIVIDIAEIDNPNYSLSGGYISSFSDLRESLWYLKQVVLDFLFNTTHLFPVFFKYLFLSIVFIFLIQIVYLLKKRRGHYHLNLLAATIILLVMLLVPFFTVVIRENHFIRYNILYSVGVFYALFYSVLIERTRTKIVRSFTVLAAAVTLLIFIHQDNVAFVGLKMLNDRDKIIASQIMERIQDSPDYASLPEGKPIAIIGKLPYKREWPFGSPNVDLGPLSDSVVNCGVFGCQLSRVEALFQLVSTGIELRKKLSPEEVRAVRQYVAQADNWPAPSSVAVVHGVIVIVFDKKLLERRIEAGG